jgi:signal transduction histidine kinase
VIGLPISRNLGISPELGWAFSAFGFAFAGVSWFGAPRMSHWAVDLLLDLVSAVATVIIANTVDDVAGFLGVIWIGFGAAVAIGRGLDRIGWLHVAWIGATSFGGLVVDRADETVAVLGWVATMGAVLVVTITVDRLTAQTRALAVAERNAREESDRASVELAEVSRHKSEFLAGMSHELRTPLNAIIGFSEVLDEGLPGELNERQAGYVADIVDSGRHLLALIDDVLDLAKVEAGRMELVLGEVDLAAVLTNAQTMLRERAQRGGIDLVLDVPERAIVTADGRKVKQVVVNLLANAVKFTPPGGRVTLTGILAPSGVALVSVADTGPGIAPEDQERIFEEFTQAGSDPSRRHEGTGLGLPLARSLVELHGGNLTVDSAPGHGATFMFTIPTPAEAGVAIRSDRSDTPSVVPGEPEVDPLVPVPFIARLGAWFGLGFALASGLSALLVDDPRFHRAIAAWGAGFAVVASIVVYVLASRITLRVINLMGVGLIAISSVGVYYAGPLRAYATYVFVTFMTLTFAFRSGRVAVTYMALVGASLGVVLAGQPDQTAPLSAWAAIMVVIGVLGYVVRNVLQQTRALAVAEREARKESERVSMELAEVSRHKSEFLAGMSHELRTPLNAIIGFSEVLDRRLPGGLNDRQARYVVDIVESGRHLLALINDVLDLAKVEAGRMDLSLGEVDLRAALDNGITLVRERAHQAGIELVLDAPSDTTLMADARKLKQIVVNLLANAVKFTPPGGRVTIQGRQDSLGQTVVSVIDTGPGIALADQDRIFEEFAQAGAGPTRAHEGTGLGLPLARSLVELHGGHLIVDSTLGHGSIFSFTLPHHTTIDGTARQLAGTA